MINGFILPIVSGLISILKFINLVEWVKDFVSYALRKLIPSKFNSGNIKLQKNIGIDLFQILKWVFIISAIYLNSNNQLVYYTVQYLIFSNLFTYFYYHTWGSQYAQSSDIQYQRRKFLNFLLSIAFFITCYAYLFKSHFAYELVWPDGGITTANALYLSITNSFAMVSGADIAHTSRMKWLLLVEFFNMFAFITIIITGSIPTNFKKDEGNN